MRKSLKSKIWIKMWVKNVKLKKKVTVKKCRSKNDRLKNMRVKNIRVQKCQRKKCVVLKKCE